MTQPMTPDEEYEFYSRPENQQPQGPARRRLTATVPVRFPPSCSSRCAPRPPPMTAQCRPGSAAPSNTNCATPPEHLKKPRGNPARVRDRNWHMLGDYVYASTACVSARRRRTGSSKSIHL